MKTLNRRKFLNKSCPILLSTIVGSTLLQYCTAEEIAEQAPISGGYSVSGNVLTIDLSHSDFGALDSKGWINFASQNLLLLKKSATEYKAFTNICPHERVKNKWSYSASTKKFTCHEHDNAFSSDCATAGKGGVLDCYKVALSGTQLKVYL